MFGVAQEEERVRNKKREETVDKIRQKFGFGSIVSGALMDSDIGIYSKNDKIERKKRKDGSE